MNKSELISDGFRQVQAGNLDAARAVFADHMHDPDVGVAAHRGLAAIAWRRGQPESAIHLLEEAIRLDEEDPDARADLGLLLMMSGRPEDSLPHWQARLEKFPRDAPALHNLGKALADCKRFAEAAEAFEGAIQFDPGQSGTYATYARAMAQAGDPERAESLWRRALEIDPTMEAAYLGLGELLFHQAKLEECLETYRQGVQAVPHSPDLHMGFGQMLEDFGDKAGGEREFRKALELRPGWVFPVEGLLTLLRGEATDDDLNQAKAILDDSTRPPRDHAMAGYGLGKALDARGDVDGAFQAWDRANGARRQQVGEFDAAALIKRVDRNIDMFSERFFQERQQWGIDDPRPVFIVGMPRSGTSLVEQIIAAHPTAYGYGELTDIAQIASNLPKGAGTMQRWPEAVSAVEDGLIKTAGQRYLNALQARHQTNASRLVDKAPMNFFYLGLIALMFPRAHVVWCQRDPRDTCVSIYAENFALSQKHATDLSALGLYYRQYARLMRHWEQVLPINMHRVSYEAVTAEPERMSRELIEFLGLPWDENCLRFYEHERPVLTPSRWQVRSPIYRGAVARWRRYEDHLTPLVEALGDELESV